MFLRKLQNRLGQIRALQLHRRNVDRDGHYGASRPPPASGIFHDPLQDELADRNDQAGFLGNGDEPIRRHESVRRMLPAQQRLERHHAVRLDVDDRLIVNFQLPRLQRLPQTGLNRNALFQAPIHRGTEQLKIITPAILGLVHRGVRMPQELAHIRAIARKHADTDADRRDQLASIDNDGRR